MRSVFGEADHAPFGGPRQELVYGRTGDGVLVHISEVASGLVCACACPACERRLVARKGARTAHHFAHYGAGEGCGRAVETNAHIWAKQVLERTKKILLPAIEAEEAGRRIVTRPAGMFQFEDVRLEKRFGDIEPSRVYRRLFGSWPTRLGRVLSGLHGIRPPFLEVAGVRWRCAVVRCCTN